MTLTAQRPSSRALSHPVFVRLWASSIASNVGTQMNNVAKAWVLYQLTHSAVALGIEGLCFSLPMAVLPLLSGALADRYDRLRLVRAMLLAEALQAFLLGGLAAAGELSPWMLYLTAAVDASRLAVAIPAQGAIVPAIVPAEALQGALAISSATWSSSALIGPALGGLLLVGAGAGWVFAVNGVTTLLALAAIRAIPRLPAPTLHESAREQVTGGFRYLRDHRRVLRLQWVLLVAMTGVLGVETLLPVLAVHTWHAGSIGYGLLRTAPGVAAITAGVALARPKTPAAQAIPVALAVAALALAAFAAAPPLAVALVLLTATSLCLTVVQILASTEIQRTVPDALRGRVTALGAVGQNGLAGVGAVAVAAAAGGVGAAWALAGLAVTLVVAGVPPLLQRAGL